MRVFRSIALLLLPAILSATATAQDTGRRGPPPPPKNLKVLPKDSPRDSVVALMRTFANGLGVRCQYCHVGREGMPLDSFDFASDEKPTKETAREMMRMVARINDDVAKARIKSTSTSAPVRVGCITCHRGAARPLMLEDTLRRVADAQGADSALAAYRALRERHHGRFAYDFGEGSLSTVSRDLAAANKLADARRFAELNAELYPQSANVAFDLARLYEQMGEKALAIAQYNKVLQMQPQNRQAAARLRALQGTP